MSSWAQICLDNKEEILILSLSPIHISEIKEKLSRYSLVSREFRSILMRKKIWNYIYSSIGLRIPDNWEYGMPIIEGVFGKHKISYWGEYSFEYGYDVLQFVKIYHGDDFLEKEYDTSYASHEDYLIAYNSSSDKLRLYHRQRHEKNLIFCGKTEDKYRELYFVRNIIKISLGFYLEFDDGHDGYANKILILSGSRIIDPHIYSADVFYILYHGAYMKFPDMGKYYCSWEDIISEKQKPTQTNVKDINSFYGHEGRFFLYGECFEVFIKRIERTVDEKDVSLYPETDAKYDIIRLTYKYMTCEDYFAAVNVRTGEFKYIQKKEDRYSSCSVEYQFIRRTHSLVDKYTGKNFIKFKDATIENIAMNKDNSRYVITLCQKNNSF